MKKMNLNRLLLLLSLAAVPLQMAAAADVPKAFSIARYQPMMERSPFAVATAVAAPAATPNFAKDIYVSSAMHSKEEDMVTIASNTDKTFKKYLTTKAPVDGYGIASIDWSDKVGATKVTISKDGSVATIGFNEALLRQPGPGGANPPQPQPQTKGAEQTQAAVPAAVPIVPGAQPPNAQPNSIKPMPVPALPQAPPPKVRGVIPRNPASNAAVPPAPQPNTDKN
jgi:hypothetical protein